MKHHFMAALLTSGLLVACSSKNQETATESLEKNEHLTDSLAQSKTHLPDTLGIASESQNQDPLVMMMENAIGKQPNEILLLENQDLKMRMYKIMGPDDSDYLKLNWEDEEKIKLVEGKYLIATGFKIVSKEKNIFHIALEKSTGALFVAIKKNGEPYYYSENRPIPDALKKL